MMHRIGGFGAPIPLLHQSVLLACSKRKDGKIVRDKK